MKWLSFVVGVMLLGLALGGCSTTQQSVQDRDAALGRAEGGAPSNYYEARQMQEIEAWKDDPGKIVHLYVNFPPGTDNILALQCKGVPGSSTESLEPNHGKPWNGSGAWRVPIDGVDVATDEMTGRDGTFGDPVEYRQCMTVDGQYIDFPAIGVPYLVSSGLYTFPPSTVKRDFEAEARLLKAEEIIKRGGCVDNETLQEIVCPAVSVPDTQAPVAPTQAP